MLKILKLKKLPSPPQKRRRNFLLNIVAYLSHVQWAIPANDPGKRLLHTRLHVRLPIPYPDCLNISADIYSDIYNNIYISYISKHTHIPRHPCCNLSNHLSHNTWQSILFFVFLFFIIYFSICFFIYKAFFPNMVSTKYIKLCE